MKLTRRSFIMATGVSAGWLATGCATAPATTGAVAGAKAAGPMTSALTHRSAKAAGPAKGAWVASTCQGCTQWCAVEIFVNEGRAVRVRGNQNSKSNHGYCCPRGHLIPQQLYSPDRIKTPLKRTNPVKGRGVDPKWVPISWDEALDTVAEKMMELRRAGEPEKFMYMRGRYSGTSTALLYGTVAKVFGSSQNFSHSAICAEAEKMAPGLTQGFYGYRDYDLDNTQCLVCWGVDPVSSNRQVPNTIHQLDRIVKRAKLISIDPRFHTTAAKSHEWLPVQPGTDGALAAAMAHVLLVEGLWSKEFVGDFKDGKNLFRPGQVVDEAAFAEKETHGVVKWWNLALKDATPTFAEKETLIPAEQIVRTARMMGAAAPKVAVWCGAGIGMSPRGTYTGMMVYALNGLLGSIDVVGGTLQTSGGIPTGKFPSFDKYIDEVAKKGGKAKKIDGRGDLDMPAMMGGKPGNGVVTNNVANALLKNPGAVKVFLASWANFNFSCTGAQRWDEAMAKIPFFAAMVTDMSEMTTYADIVLPATFNAAEGLSVIGNMSNTYSYYSIQQPVVKRLWDVKQEETEVPWLLAKKLKEKGFPNLFDYYSTEFKDPDTGKLPTNELEFGEIQAKITIAPVWKSKEPLKGESVKNWEEFKARGMVSGPKYSFKKGWGGKFATPTKKFEFYSEALKKGLTEHAAKHKTTVDNVLAVSNYTARGELAFVPHYEPAKRHGSYEQYPFEFVDYKSRLNREGRSSNLPWYHEFKKMDPGDVSWDDVVKMNPADATRLGLKEGDMVKLSSVSGSITVKLHLWQGIRPGTVTKAYGQGHWAYGRVASKEFGKTPRGANNNELLVDDYDRLSGATARNGGFTGVQIVKA